MPLATRHLPWLVLLLLLAGVPIALAALRPGRWDDCADPAALRDSGRFLEGTPGAEFQRFFRRHVFQRDEGTLPAGPGLEPLRYRLLRSDEARYPYEQPTRFLRIPMDPERSVVRWVEADGDRLPIHLQYAHLRGIVRVVASVFVYDGRLVDSLLPLQIGSAARQLVRGRRPMTVFQVDGFGPPARQQQIEDPAIAWLASAWQAYRSICLPPPAPVRSR